MSPEKQFTWSRQGGYQVSSKGDRRFSAFNAIMSDGRSIEMHYQCDTKRFQPGGTDWRLGKGKPPLDLSVDLWGEYLALWREWATNNPELMLELRQHALEHQGVLSDCFAGTPINQAHALVTLLNAGYGKV